MEDFDKQLIDLEAKRQELLAKKAAEEAAIETEEVPEQVKVICAVQLALTEKGPIVNIQNDIFSASGLLDYAQKYVGLLMENHIRSLIASQQAPPEEAEVNESPEDN